MNTSSPALPDSILALTSLTDFEVKELQAESGLCHVFAVALGQLSGLPYSIHIGTREIWDADEELLGEKFTHAVVELNHKFYDAQGSDAMYRWEDRWSPAVFRDEDGETSSFDWTELPNSPSLDAVKKHLDIEFPGAEIKHIPLSEMLANINSVLAARRPQRSRRML